MLTNDLMKQLEKTMLLSRKLVRGQHKGERRSRMFGSSLEFADFRPYVPGDDIRQVDWKLYGRTQKHYIKQYLDEQELQVNLFIDTSQSMAFGHPSKLFRAKQYAAAFAYMTLFHYDRVSVRPFSNRMEKIFPLMGGRGAVAKVFQFIEELDAEGEGGFRQAFASRLPRTPGLSIILSDFMTELEALFYIMRVLQSLKQEVLLLQILNSRELEPDYSGDFRLVDSESKDFAEVVMSPLAIKHYQEALKQHTEEIRRFARNRSMGFVQVRTDEPLEKVVMSTLRESGWLR